jgi:[ribosomal protein S5]-alanine N-acetyltransferase
MRAEGSRIYIRLLEMSDARALHELRRRNKEFLAPWEPRPPQGEDTLEAQRAQLRFALDNATHDRGYHFGVFLPDTDELVGTITLSNVARGAWHNATLGYFVDEDRNGQGFATEAIELVVTLAFEELGLHRVQAGVMPRNPASMRALEKAGFRREGVSLNYLRINDVWEDHVMFAITVEDLAT